MVPLFFNNTVKDVIQLISFFITVYTFLTYVSPILCVMMRDKYTVRKKSFMGVRNKKCEKLKRPDSKILVFSPESQYEKTNTIILFFVIITSETNQASIFSQGNTCQKTKVA